MRKMFNEALNSMKRFQMLKLMKFLKMREVNR